VQAKPILSATEAVLYVSDFRRSCDFFLTKLGFEIESEFFQRLETEPWGARNFVVKDPDGNLLLFAGPGE
jgi:hypothetical protein